LRAAAVFDIIDIKFGIAMADLLIRDIGEDLKRKIESRARKSRRSLSAEAKILLQRGLAAPAPTEKMGTFLFSLVDEKYRGDDLVFEIDDPIAPPPKFE
jgi:plasmid stability protein